MPARDIYHPHVKTALQKEGWHVSADPYVLRAGVMVLYVDLGAEKLLTAEKGNEKIAVEIKSFLQASEIAEFHTALGQFMNYRVALNKQEPDRKLYLAVSTDAYESFFTQAFIQEVLQQYKVSLVVFDPVQEIIQQWIK